MKIFLILMVSLAVVTKVFAHGRSPEMVEMLNAPVPEWMSLAAPIRVELVGESKLTEGLSFRPRSGGATNSRNRVQIPDRGIEFQVPYGIVWSGNNAEGLGVSLNFEGDRLLVNSGAEPPVHLYEISSDGHIQEVPIRLPRVTYDAGRKGYISRWSWAGNSVVIGRSGITDEAGHVILEWRLYAYHIKERALARLDLSALNLSDEDFEGLDVVAVADDLRHLRLRLGGREMVVRADLQSPPRPLAKSDSGAAPSNSSAGNPTRLPESLETTMKVSPAPASNALSGSTTWLWVAGLLFALFGVLWWFVHKRGTSRPT